MRHPWRFLISVGRLALFVTFALFAAGAGAAAPPQENPAVPPALAGGSLCTGDGVYLYDDINYGGACLKWTSDDPELGDDGFHDRASSIRFVGSYAGGRYRATLYEHHSYTGASTTFSGDDPWLGDDAIGNDRADSIRIQVVPFCDLVSGIPRAECEALVALYNATFGPYWTHRDLWLTPYTNPCTWYGVGCSSGHVTRLDLYHNNLGGSIPASLGNLSYLQQLNLMENYLAGSIPSSLGDLSQLQVLRLFDNQLTGGIPASLGNLSNLRLLYLWSNQLTGGIPSSLGNLASLQDLSLGGNQLTGGIPDSLGNLSSLVLLSLHDNPLSGALPQGLKNLPLATFHFHNTSLCEPPDAAFQAWLAGISDLRRTGMLCAPTATPTPTPTPTRTPTRPAPNKVFLPIIMRQRLAPGPQPRSQPTASNVSPTASSSPAPLPPGARTATQVWARATEAVPCPDGTVSLGRMQARRIRVD